MTMTIRLAALSALMMFLAVSWAHAQGVPIGGPGGPIDVSADQGIEWHQEVKAYVARGNAKAVRGTSTITADVLTAYYREVEGKGSEVYRLVGEGNVHVFSPTQEVFGDRSDYDMDRKIAVITGNALRMITQTDTVTARDSLEYYEEKQLAVARGNAIAVRKDTQMRADTLLGLFVNDKDGKQVMDRLDGVGNVVVTTATDIARGERAMYSTKTNVAVLTGNVRITRGENQINGDAAEMNMTTKINRVLSAGQRIQGLLVSNEGAQTPAEGAKAPAERQSGSGKPGAAAPSPAVPPSPAAAR